MKYQNPTVSNIQRLATIIANGTQKTGNCQETSDGKSSSSAYEVDE